MAPLFISRNDPSGGALAAKTSSLSEAEVVLEARGSLTALDAPTVSSSGVFHVPAPESSAARMAERGAGPVRECLLGGGVPSG
jgi:hypothetical protein